MNDEKNYRIFRWIDNSVVKMVSTVHMGLEGEDIEANRRRPRLNPTNKNNVANVALILVEVWMKNIWIKSLMNLCCFIDHYEKNANGVSLKSMKQY